MPLRELDDARLARPVTVGVFRGRRASEWRLTFYRCDKTGELPTTQWQHEALFLSPPGRTQKATRKDATRIAVHEEGRESQIPQ